MTPRDFLRTLAGLTFGGLLLAALYGLKVQAARCSKADPAAP
jgi:hypothetical protein